ncbi:tetraacyldisaccharide 4'-kinase [Alteromonas flava]|uniref:tetraacyldisaccharide 4'-kinase n=1 Tax=Alteromonas flava TaxID=2048003 RepID=UPI000C2888E9|nr:tetraacyldisaccharide 4'-kinase [Alteromonas flava]
MSIQKVIETGWYQNKPWLWVLWPLSVLFALLSALRRVFYRFKLIKSNHPGVPVIVIGNLTVGGNGKTPLVLALANYLLQHGRKVGVLSRGYGGQQAEFPYCVQANDRAAQVGDEPLLITRRLQCPVVIDPIRTRGAKYLVELGCNVIVCDDGLQHYALQRDIEWIVIDDRGFGNCRLLPSGPMREGVWRLRHVTGVVHNGKAPLALDVSQNIPMQLTTQHMVNVADSSLTLTLDDFKQRYASLDGVCAIGNPQRFFNSLAEQGISLKRQLVFNDHHLYRSSDLPQGALVMTEKDAVKCQAFAHPDWWFLQIDAQLSHSFFTQTMRHLIHAETNLKRKNYGI